MPFDKINMNNNLFIVKKNYIKEIKFLRGRLFKEGFFK